MTAAGKHAKEETVNTRARVCAWLVFISMAGTTMSFQVYHSVKHGNMPWPLAGLYGIVPLAISMLLIEVVSGWENAPEWVRWAAYLIIGGAMYLSASATGAVVLRAAPAHASLLFGVLLDGAAIIAARFLMTIAKTAAASKRAALEVALEAERAARQAAEAERDTARLEAAQAAGREAAFAAEQADTKAATQAATQADTGPRYKGDTKSGVSAGRRGSSGTGRRADAARKTSVPADIDIQTEALRILASDPGISGSELGRRLGVQESYGRRLRNRLSAPAPGGGR